MMRNPTRILLRGFLLSVFLTYASSTSAWAARSIRIDPAQSNATHTLDASGVPNDTVFNGAGTYSMDPDDTLVAISLVVDLFSVSTSYVAGATTWSGIHDPGIHNGGPHDLGAVMTVQPAVGQAVSVYTPTTVPVNCDK